MLYLGDCSELLPTLADNSVHLILSDIPYGISAEPWDVLHNNTNSALLGSSPAQKKSGLFKSRGKPINGWSEADRRIGKEYQEWCESWAPQWLRILKPGGSAIVFAGRRNMSRCSVALENSGFCLRDILGWIKPKATYRAQRVDVVLSRRGSASDWQGWRLGNLSPTFEPILWFFKPYAHTVTDNLLEHGVGASNHDAYKLRTNALGNYIRCPDDSPKAHPHQKPLELLRTLIELTTLEGQTVLDPFAGSGSSLLAAKELGRKYIGIERDPNYFEMMQGRLNLADTSGHNSEPDALSGQESASPQHPSPPPR